MKFSPSQLERCARDWTKVAGGETVTVEQVNGVLYAFGSELACLRLFRVFSDNPSPDRKPYCEYSANRQSWVFSLPGL